MRKCLNKVVFDKEKIVKYLLISFIVITTFLFVFKIYICEDISISDEAHMYATSYRLLQGDALLVDDWSPEQLYGVVLLPFITIFRLVVGSNEGLFLFMRYVYLAMKLVVLFYGLKKIKNIELCDKSCLYLGLFMWYFFSSWNIEALTYQQFPLIMAMFIVISLLTNNTSKLEWVMVGMAYALCILSQPFILLSYVFVLGWIIYKIFNDRKVSKESVFVHIGIMLVFVIFVILLFSRARLEDIVRSIPFIFQEQDHNVAGTGIMGLFNQKIIHVCNVFISENLVTTYINVFFIIVLHVAFICDWKFKNNLVWFIPLILLLSIFSMIPLNKMFLMNEMFIPFIWASLESLFFVRNKLYLKLLFLSYIFVISIALGTNTGKITTSGALCLVAVIFVFFCGDYKIISVNKESSKKIDILKRLLFLTPIVIIVGIVLFLRVYITWWGVPLSNDSYANKITVGPMKGLYANDDEYSHYMNIYNDINSMDIDSDDILFCGTASPMAYLDAEAAFGTMGTPFFSLDYDRLKAYWDSHPDKIPTAIYYEKYTSVDSESFVNDMLNDYIVTTNGQRLMALKRY